MARAEPAAHHARGYAASVALAFVAAVLWSFTGLAVRTIESASDWQIIFYRSLSAGVVILAFAAARQRGRLAAAILAPGGVGLAAGASFAGAIVFFLFALQNTTVANAAFLNSVTPLLTAILGWMAFGEAVLRRTWIAIMIAMTGVVVMVVDGLTFGGWVGSMLALVATAMNSVTALSLRHGRRFDMMPAMGLGSLLAAAVAALAAGGVSLSLRDLAICLASGIFTLAGANILFTICARHVPAAELTLLFLAELAMSPVWVWLAVGEAPSVLTILGGAIVFGAAILQAWPVLQAGLGRLIRRRS